MDSYGGSCHTFHHARFIGLRSIGFPGRVASCNCNDWHNLIKGKQITLQSGENFNNLYNNFVYISQILTTSLNCESHHRYEKVTRGAYLEIKQNDSPNYTCMLRVSIGVMTSLVYPCSMDTRKQLVRPTTVRSLIRAIKFILENTLTKPNDEQFNDYNCKEHRYLNVNYYSDYFLTQ